MSAKVGTSVEEAVYWLRRGEPVALPTETVYGLAAPLGAVAAIEKIFLLKQRPFQNPLIVHVADAAGLASVAEVNASAAALVKQFWPGPLTLVLKKRACVPDLVSAGQPSVAVRCPSNPIFQQVLSQLGEPLVAPSANKFQHISPTTPQHVLADMGDVLPYILDGGPCRFGLESTILSLLEESQPVLLRPGPISQAQLEAVLMRPIRALQPASHGPAAEGHLAPGLYRKHYSPQTPLYLVQDLEHFVPDAALQKTFTAAAAHIFIYPPARPLAPHEFVLSPQRSLSEAAANLFGCLQRLDRQHWSSLWIEIPPSQGVGQAMRDRLSRAAHFNLSQAV